MVFRLKRKEFEINCVTRRGMFLHSIIGCECWNHSKILLSERLKNRFQMNDSIISYAYWIDSIRYSTDALCPIRLDKFIVFIVLCLNGAASLFVTKCQNRTHSIWISTSSINLFIFAEIRKNHLLFDGRFFDSFELFSPDFYAFL